MNDKTKLLGALVLGAIAGVVIVKLLESEKGQAFVEGTKEKVKSAADDVKIKIKQLEEELTELLNIEQENNTSSKA